MTTSGVAARTENLQGWAEHPSVVSWLAEWCNDQPGLWSAAQIARALGDPGTQARGRFVGSRLVAVLLSRFFDGTMEIDFLATLEQDRRQGHMTALLLTERRRQGAEKVWLDVHCQNRSAQAFYRKLGFQKGGERPNYYGDGATAELWSWNTPLKSKT